MKAQGYGILLASRELAHDLYSGAPYFTRRRREAERELKGLSPWVAFGARVVRVEVDGNIFTVRL